MNIDKYVYESGLIASGCWDKFDDYDQKALEKFAELIVRECGMIADDYRDEHLRSLPSDTMKKHFGME